MSPRRAAVVAVLVAGSVGVAFVEAYTQYAGLPLGRAVGYGLAPWLIAAAIAGIKKGIQRVRGRSSDFVSSLLWGTGLLLAILVLGHVVSGRLALMIAMLFQGGR